MQVFLILLLQNTCANSQIQFKYDNAGRLTQLTYPNQTTIFYTYDPDGNRITSTINLCATKPKAKITPFKDSVICIGDSVILKSDSAYSYKWSTGATTQSIVVKTSGIDTLIVSNAFGCKDTAKITITVNPFPILTIIPSATVLCQGKTDTLSVIGATSYKWSGPNLTDSISSKIVVIPSSGTTSYTVSGTANGCSANKSVSITVNPLPTDITPMAQSLMICAGTSTNIQIPASQNGVNYQLRNNATNALIGTSVNGTGGTLNLPTDPLSAITTFNVLATNLSSSCSVVMTTVVTITVNPLPVIAPSVLPNPVCQGSTVTLSANGANTYSWSGPNLNTTTGASVTANPATFGTLNYMVTGTTNSCSDSIKVPVTVNPGPAVTLNPLPAQTLCINGIPTTLTAAGSGTGISYQWYSNTTNATTGGTPLSGATGSNYIPSTTSAGTFYYYCTITQAGTMCPTATSSLSTVTIVATPSISAQPLSSQNLCVNVTPTPLTVAAMGGTGSFTYQWYSNATGSTNAGTPLPLANSASYAPAPTFITGTTYYYCSISQSGTGCGILTSNAAAVTINQQPSLSITATPNPVCAGSLVTLTARGAASYAWSGPNLNATTGASVTANPATVGDNTYVVEGNNNGCTYSVPYIVTVTQAPTFSTLPLATQSLCRNTTPTDLKVAMNGFGSFSYQWYSNTTNATMGGTPLTGKTEATFSPPTTTPGTFYYYCIATQLGAACPTATSTIAQVTVTDTVPKITIGQTSCIAGTVSFALSSGTGGGTSPQYQWQQRKDAASLWIDSIGATGTTFILAHASNGTQVRLRLSSNALCAQPPVVYSDPSVINCIITAIPVIDGLESFSVYPNPTTTGSFTVKIKLNTIKTVSLIVYDLGGQIVYQSASQKIIGENKIQVPLPLVAAGGYMLKVSIGKQNFVVPVIIEK